MTTLKSVNVRHMEKSDMPAILLCEQESHKIVFNFPEAPLLGDVEVLQPWAWSEQDFIGCMRLYRSKTQSNFDTRVLVAEVAVQAMDADNIPYERYEVMGACAYQLMGDGYDILLLTANPNLKLSDFDDGPTLVRHSLIEKMLEKAERAEKRTKVSITIPDGDWETLKFFRKLGWVAKLLPYHFTDSNDAWYCEYQAAVSESETETEPVV